MRIYHGQPTQDQLRKCREAAPSHVHGAQWEPSKGATPHDVPYILDNGAFTDSFNPKDWLAMLDRVQDRMPLPPDFVILPDRMNNIEGTLERHREWIHEVEDRGLRPAPVMQPGMPVETQAKLYAQLDVDVIFVGGEGRWQRSHAQQILDAAHNEGMLVHVGNPGGETEFHQWARMGVDSMDTTTIVVNGYYDRWLGKLDSLSTDSPKKGGRQNTLQESLVASDGGPRE